MTLGTNSVSMLRRDPTRMLPVSTPLRAWTVASISSSPRRISRQASSSRSPFSVRRQASRLR